MQKLLAGVFAAGIIGSMGALGTGVAAADPDLDPTLDTALIVGGAKAPGIPWTEITNRVGRGYDPNAKRSIVDYPGGMVYGHLPARLLPGKGADSPTVGESVAVGEQNLDAAIRGTSGPLVAMGLSEGTMVLDAEQVRLMNDPDAPPPDRLSFIVFGDPTRGMFHQLGIPPGSYIPVEDYTMPPPLENSQYDTTIVTAEYDGIGGDFPNDTSNLLAVLNAAIGGLTHHTYAAFTRPGDVPPESITSTRNWRGATITSYLVPAKQLPLTLPLRAMGMSDQQVDQIDAELRPIIDAAYFDHRHPADPGPNALDVVQAYRSVEAATSHAPGQDTMGQQMNSLFPKLVN